MATVNLTIQSSQVDSTLTDFPVYVDLSDMPSGFWDEVLNGGGDIRVYKSDGTTELAREVVSCDTSTETGQLHFLADTISHTTDTLFKITVDGVSSDYAVGATYGRDATWANKDLVYHLEETSGSTATDSTGDNDGTYNGNVPDAVTGQIGNGQDFDGSGDYIATGYTGQGLNKTYSFWIDTTTTSQQWIVGGRQTGTIRRIDIRANSGAGAALDAGKLLFYLTDASGNRRLAYTTSDTDFNDGDKHLIQATFRSTSIEIDIDGVSIPITYMETGTLSSFTFFSGPYIGAFNNNPTALAPFIGEIDEFRIEDALTTDEKKAVYVNQATPTTFYTAAMDDGGGGTAYRSQFRPVRL